MGVSLILTMHPTDDTIGQTAVSARTPCAETLTQIGNLRDRDRQVRGAAVRALGRSGEAQAVEPLCAALQDEDTYVRFAAAWALWQLADERAVEPLCAALEDSVAEVRSAAVYALGRLGDLHAVPLLCGIVRGRDRSVRYSAAVALWELGDATALPLRILSATTLPPTDKLRYLEALADLSYTSGICDPWPRMICYAFGSVQALCERLGRQGSLDPSVRCGTEAVLAELRNRADAAILLRAAEREEAREPQELLRAASCHPVLTAPEELLRPSEPASRSNPRTLWSLLTRFFRRR